MKKYIALSPVGRFKTGDEVKGITEERAQFLAEHGCIELIELKTKTTAKTTARKSATSKPSTKTAKSE